jgi:3-deoxy-D-manno-octulosonate 8-phosphate phosphatase (KDO 8-P phosphatase)
MNTFDPQQLPNIFKGEFLAGPEELLQRLLKVKAYIFDWDGVFNNGDKDATGSSPFNEVDSMGINMLRFHHYLRMGHNPHTAVITGEKNVAAFTLAKREHFATVYSSIKNKKHALQHFCSAKNIALDEVAFFFDDVLDLAIAGSCGLRVLVGNSCNPMFVNLVKEKKLADYITACQGGNNALREATELLMGLTGQYNDTILQRAELTDNYQQYLAERNTMETTYFTLRGSEIVKQMI